MSPANKRRTEIDENVAATVQFAFDRTCCVCRVRSKPYQIHHIDENPGNACTHELSVPKKIRVSTKSTDLAIVGIDMDDRTQDATRFLKLRGFDWPDFTYRKEMEMPLGVKVIPLAILDSEGNATYYHSGGGGTRELVKAIAAFGESYRVVSVD
jgi:hypothetical protein